MNGIKIIIKGPRQSGKSVILFLLKYFFKHLNMVVIHKVQSGCYHNSEHIFDNFTSKYFFKTIKKICEEESKFIILEEEDMTPMEEEKFSFDISNEKRDLRFNNIRKKY